MTDARFPERWLHDRRLLRCSDPAFRLYVTAMTWSVSNRTEGILDDGDLALVPNVDGTRAAELEKLGLWAHERDTWVIVDFANSQTSRGELDVLENLRRRERAKKARQRAGSPGQSRGNVPGDSAPGPQRLGKARQGKDSTKADRDGETENWPDLPPLGDA